MMALDAVRRSWRLWGIWSWLRAELPAVPMLLVEVTTQLDAVQACREARGLLGRCEARRLGRG